MAIYRNIQMSFWTDTKVADDFTPEDKYFYLYLFTNPHTNLAGCYEISVRQISNETGYNKSTVERLIKRFENTHKVIVYSEESKEMLVVNWHKYNWTKSLAFRKALEKEIASIKNVHFKEYLQNIYDGIDTVPRPSLDGMGTTVTDTVTDNIDINNINNINNSNNNTNNSYSISFESIYKEYPRKGEKKKAYSCFQTRLKEGYSEEELMIATKNYAAQCEKEHREEKYIKLASTFFGVNTPFVDYLPKGPIVTKSQAKEWGYQIYDESQMLVAPYYGFPKEWFDGEELIKERVKPIIWSKPIPSGEREVDVSAEDLIAEYESRRRVANGKSNIFEYPGGHKND